MREEAMLLLHKYIKNHDLSGLKHFHMNDKNVNTS